MSRRGKVATGIAALLCIATISHQTAQTHHNRIDVEYLQRSDMPTMVAQCDQLGGELIFTPSSDRYVCEDIRKNK